MIRWLDLNDTCSGALTTHPSDAIAPILMTADYLSRVRIAARREPLVMRDVLEAMVKAYEIQGALGMLNDFRRFGIDQPLLTRVAGAAVVTHLLGGTRDEVLNAVSNAWIESSLLVVRHAPNIGPRKNWATADASFAAVRLAMMALKGEPGYPWVLTAKDYGFYDARCGGEALRFEAPYGENIIQRCMYKLVPAGMHGQTAAECAFKLHPLVKDRLGEVDRVTIRCHAVLKRIMDKRGALRNAADRDHCVHYLVALGLINGRIEAGDFSDGFAADPRIDALREKTFLVEEARYTADFSDPAKRSSANAVQVQFADGSSTPNVEVEYPIGHPRRRAEALPRLREKIRSSLRRRFPPARCERILAALDDRAGVERTAVSEFVALLI
jgi:2-methylcitrate dehydratase